MSNPVAGWSWRGRLGIIFAGLYLLLVGIKLLGVVAPDVLIAVVALVAGVCLILSL